MKQIRFLGWDKTLPERVPPLLLENGRRCGENLVDLSGIMVLIPGRHASRILNEKMASLLEPLAAGLLPPEFYTPERFILEGAEHFPAASEMEVAHVWKKVLENCGPEEFPNLFPRRFEEQTEAVLAYLAGQFMQLVGELSAGGRSVADVCRLSSLVDPERWNEILTLQKQVRNILAEAKLMDPEELKGNLASSVTEFRRFERILVIGMPDLSALLLKRLAKAAESMEVEIWVHAPEALADRFDGWGRPIPEKWAAEPLAFSRGEKNGIQEIYRTETVEQMASVAAALLLENGRNLDGKSVAVGNEKLFMPLCRELSTLTLPDGKNLNVLNPSGEPMRGLRLFDLLSRLRNFLSDSRFEHARALIQHPDVLRRLAEEFALEENRILNLVDRCVIRHLPDQFNTVFQTAEPEVRPLFELLAKLRENGLRKSSLSELIHDWIRWVYSTGTPPPSHGIPLESETAALEEVLKIMQNSPLFRNASLPECFGELLLRIAGRRLYRKREVHDFPVGGFLELPWSDAREIILCGMNDGLIPESVRGSSFLSDSRRKALNLPNNAQRAARDQFYLESILHSHPAGTIRFLASRFDSESRPQSYSRFFFQGDRKTVLERAALLYESMRMPDFSAGKKSGGLHFILQPDYSAKPVEEPVISVTAFRDYLASPFRFFLKNWMKMSPTDFELKEMDRAGFGSCCHTALERAGRKAVSDPDRMKELLFEELDRFMRETYGAPLPPLLAIQNEQIKQRLAWCAVRLAECAETFKVLELEYPLGGEHGSLSFAGLRIRGRIDRIDYSPEQNLLRLIDYKTMDDGDSPEKAHWNARKRIFTDLQLPLYRILVERDPEFRTRHPEIDFRTVRILCGYLSMPKSVTDTRFQFWEEMETLLPEAEQTIRRISDEIREMAMGIFHEDPDQKVKYDDFQTIFLPDLRSAVPSAVWKNNAEEGGKS